MRKGDLRYRILENLDIQTLEFRSQSSEGFIFHCDKSNEVILWEQAVNQLYISYRMVLTDCEELLRNKIDKVHSKLREQNIKFDPLGSVSAVYKYSSAYFEPVHRYNKKTGMYIDSFSSISEAFKELDKPTGGNISEACNGKRFSAYKYRWSYEKKNKL